MSDMESCGENTAKKQMPESEKDLAERCKHCSMTFECKSSNRLHYTLEHQQSASTSSLDKKGRHVRAQRVNGEFVCSQCGFSIAINGNAHSIRQINIHQCSPPMQDPILPTVPLPGIDKSATGAPDPTPCRVMSEDDEGEDLGKDDSSSPEAPISSGGTTVVVESNIKSVDLETFSLAINATHRVLICVDHKTIVKPDTIQNHLHHAKGHSLSMFLKHKDHILRLIKEGGVCGGQIDAPRFPVSALPHLPPPVQGFHCQECPYAIANDKGSREHEKKGHAMERGPVQQVQHHTYWKVVAQEEPAFSVLNERVVDQIKHMTDELFRPKLSEIPDSLANIQLRQFLKEVELDVAYKDVNMESAMQLCNTNTTNDMESHVIRRGAISYFNKVIPEASKLTMLTRQRIGGMHEEDSMDYNVHNVKFNPGMMLKSTRMQYLLQLHQLGVFMMRAIVTKRPSSSDHYGQGVQLCFSEEQEQTAQQLHQAVRQAIDTDCEGDDEASIERVAECLHQVALSVFFTVPQQTKNRPWEGAWRRFFAFGNLTSDGRPPRARDVSVWLTHVKFIMMLAATHKIYCEWSAQLGKEDSLTSDEIGKEWLSKWMSKRQPSPYHELRTWAAEATKYRATEGTMNNVDWLTEDSMLYRGTIIDKGAIGRVCKAFVSEARTTMAKLGATDPLPEDYGSVKDDGTAYSVLQSGECYVHDRVQKTVTDMLTNDEYFWYDEGDGRHKIHSSAARSYLNNASMVNDALLGALFLGTGMPSRANELTSVCYCASRLNNRQVFVEPSASGPILRLRVAYNKVNAAQHREKPIFRFAFPELSELVLCYLIDIRPKEIIFARELYGEKAEEVLKTRLFYHFTTQSGGSIREHTTGKELTSTLNSVTLQEMNAEFGASELRHIVASMGRKMGNITKYMHLTGGDEVYDLQAGHSTTISDRIYARCGDDSSRVSEAFRACSKMWWTEILGIPVPESDIRTKGVADHMLGDGTAEHVESAQLEQLESRLSKFQEDMSKNMQLIISLLDGQKLPDPRRGRSTRRDPSPDGTPRSPHRPNILPNPRIETAAPREQEPEIASLGCGSRSQVKRDNRGIDWSSGAFEEQMSNAFPVADSLRPYPAQSASTSLKRVLDDVVVDDWDTLSRTPLKKARTQPNSNGSEGAKFGAIALEHIQGLRNTIGDKTASYRTNDQYEVFRSLVEREQHILHVSRTGGGKTLPFQLALKYWEPSVKGIVILPYSMLYQPFKHRFDAIGLHAQICNPQEKLKAEARVYIVGLNQFLSPKLQESFRALAQTQRLGAVMFDEVDGAVIDSEFRPHFRWAIEKALQLPNTVCVFSSATIPAKFEHEWIRQLPFTCQPTPTVGLDGDNWALKGHPAIRVIRSRCTERLNITYRIITYGNRRDEMENALKDAVSQGSHTVIYVVKHDSVKEVGELLDTHRQIHGATSLVDRRKHVEGLGEGTRSILVGNKAAYYGFDVPNVDHVIFLVERGSPAPKLVEFVQGAGRAGRTGKPATVTILAPEYGPQGEPLDSWTVPEPSGFGGQGEFVRMVKGSRCIRSMLSGHMDGWIDMDCFRMNAELSDGRGQGNAVYVALCSRCKAKINGGKLQESAWAPLEPQAMPKTWVEAMQMTKWSEWVEGSHLLSPPVQSSSAFMMTWGHQQPAQAGAPIRDMFELCEARQLESLRGQRRVRDILRTVGPGCVICISKHLDAPNHPPSQCNHFPYHQRASSAMSANLAGKDTTYKAWKRTWADKILKMKVHGICFTCMLPETGDFHTFEHGSNGRIKKQCRYADVVPPLAWYLRKTGTFREQLRMLTGDQINSTDRFDHLTFAITKPHQGPPTSDGACALLRVWYSLVCKQEGWRTLDSEQTMHHMLHEVLDGMDKGPN